MVMLLFLVVFLLLLMPPLVLVVVALVLPGLGPGGLVLARAVEDVSLGGGGGVFVHGVVVLRVVILAYAELACEQERKLSILTYS